MPKPTVLLAAAVIALALVSLYLSRELRMAREETRALQTRIGELEALAKTRPGSASIAVGQANASAWQPGPLPPWSSPANSPAVVMRHTPVVAMGHAQVAEAVTMGPEMNEEFREEMRKHFEQQRALLQDPEYRAALIEQQKQGFWQAYPDVDQELGLTDAQTDQLFTLLAEQQLRSSDDMETRFSTEPLDAAASEQMLRRHQEQQERDDRELAELLGPKFQAWKDYQATLGVRHHANELRTALARKGVALDDAQWRPLVKALAAQQQAFTHMTVTNGGGIAGMSASFAVAGTGPAPDPVAMDHNDMIQLMTQQSERMRAGLEGILTAEQLRVIDEQQALALKLMRAQLRVTEKVANAGR